MSAVCTCERSVDAPDHQPHYPWCALDTSPGLTVQQALEDAKRGHGWIDQTQRFIDTSAILAIEADAAIVTMPDGSVDVIHRPLGKPYR